MDTAVTAVQAMVLLFLHDEDEITSAELGGRTHLDSATLAGVLDRLQEAGLVERRRHPVDGRSIEVCLTAQGRDLAVRLTTIKDRANVDQKIDAVVAAASPLRAMEIEPFKEGWCFYTGCGWAGNWLGMFLTAMALTLGAPFWFNALKTAVILRDTLKPKEADRS